MDLVKYSVEMDSIIVDKDKKIANSNITVMILPKNDCGKISVKDFVRAIVRNIQF